MSRRISLAIACLLGACYSPSGGDDETEAAASSESSGTPVADDDGPGTTMADDDDGQTSMPGVDDSTTSLPADSSEGSGESGPGESTDDGTTGGGSIVDGQYLLALATTLEPDLPLQMFATSTLDPANGTLTITLQCLSLDQGSTTEPRELVGPVYTYPGIVPDPGGFTADLGTLMVPGAANPITGADVVATVVLEVSLFGDAFCGTASGMVISPLSFDLAGSTFASVSVPDIDTLPLEFPTACR